MLPAGFLFLDASNDCQTARVSGRKKNLPMQESCYRLHILYHMFKVNDVLGGPCRPISDWECLFQY